MSKKSDQKILDKKSNKKSDPKIEQKMEKKIGLNILQETGQKNEQQIVRKN